MKNKEFSELEALVVLKNNSEEIIKTIRDSVGIDNCIKSLMEQFRLTEEQAKYLCKLTLRDLSSI